MAAGHVVEGQRWRTDPDKASAAPVLVAGGGPAATGRGGRGGGRGGNASTPSADGKWEAAAVDDPPKIDMPEYASEFEKRHQERFKGVIFDWKDFQRDGAEFPAPNPVAQPATADRRPAAAGVGGRRAEGARGHAISAPANLAWHPNGQTIAFTADPDWRNELQIQLARSVDGARSTAR